MPIITLIGDSGFGLIIPFISRRFQSFMLVDTGFLPGPCWLFLLYGCRTWRFFWQTIWWSVFPLRQSAVRPWLVAKYYGTWCALRQRGGHSAGLAGKWSRGKLIQYGLNSAALAMYRTAHAKQAISLGFKCLIISEPRLISVLVVSPAVLSSVAMNGFLHATAIYRREDGITGDRFNLALAYCVAQEQVSRSGNVK